MKGREPRSEDFIAFLQVSDIGAAETLARGARALGINGTRIVAKPLVANIDRAVIGKKVAVASVTRWHHAVEHIHAPRNGLDKVGGCTHPHQVAGSLRWHTGSNPFQNGQSFLLSSYCRFGSETKAIVAAFRG